MIIHFSPTARAQSVRYQTVLITSSAHSPKSITLNRRSLLALPLSRAQTLACAAFSLRDIMEDKCTVTVKLFLKVSLKPLGRLVGAAAIGGRPPQRAKYPLASKAPRRGSGNHTSGGFPVPSNAFLCLNLYLSFQILIYLNLYFCCVAQ